MQRRYAAWLQLELDRLQAWRVQLQRSDLHAAEMQPQVAQYNAAAASWSAAWLAAGQPTMTHRPPAPQPAAQQGAAAQPQSQAQAVVPSVGAGQAGAGTTAAAGAGMDATAGAAAAAPAQAGLPGIGHL